MNVLIIAIGIAAVMLTGFAFASRLGNTGDVPYQTTLQGEQVPGAGIDAGAQS